MFYKMPTVLFIEDGCVQNHADDIAKLGKRALIVTGHSSEKNGSLSDITDALKSKGIEYSIFNNVEENPCVETVEAAARQGVEFGADFVIGIGGGSPLDASKAVAVLVKNADCGRDILFDNVDRGSVPILSVPTTCGTGSEVTQYSIITVHDIQSKKNLPKVLFPTLSLIDPKYLTTTPMSVLCSTAVDALGHFWESYINTHATDLSRMFVQSGLALWKKSLPVLKGLREATLDDYRNMMTASSLAGMAIAHTSTSLPHGLSYALTYDCNMAHGKAIGYFQGGYLKEAKPAMRATVLSMAGFYNVDDYQQFYNDVCKPPMVSTETLERAVAAVLSNPSKKELCPFDVDEAVLRRIAGL